MTMMLGLGIPWFVLGWLHAMQYDTHIVYNTIQHGTVRWSGLLLWNRKDIDKERWRGPTRWRSPGTYCVLTMPGSEEFPGGLQTVW